MLDMQLRPEDEIHVPWVLSSPTGDIGWPGHANALSDPALLYCISSTQAKVEQGAPERTRLKKLRAIARKRGLAIGFIAD